MTTSTERRGSALLSVLWLSAALAAIAFSLASTVRSETERTSNAVDGLRCNYLAAAGIEKAAMQLLWSATTDNKLIPKGATQVIYEFPSGQVRVQIIPETAKLDVNTASVEDIGKLLTALGIGEGRGAEIAGAIVDWRTPGSGSRFDTYYSSLTSSFEAPHASFGEIEELLAVKGVTPDIFFGSYTPAGGGDGLVRRAGLIDCLSVYGSNGGVDINTADPAVLEALGISAADTQTIAQRRNQKPFDTGSLGEFGNGRLRVEGNSIVTFRATARLRLPNGLLSDLRRTSAAQVKYLQPGASTDMVPYHVLRWFDTAWSN